MPKSRPRASCGLSLAAVLLTVLTVCVHAQARANDPAAKVGAQTAPVPAAAHGVQDGATAPAPSPPSPAEPRVEPTAAASEQPSAAGATAAATPAAPAPTPVPATVAAPRPAAAAPCTRTVKAKVVALAQPFMLNRLGASMPNGLTFALESDVDLNLRQLNPNKRPRPLVLRANAGDCLEITLTNLIKPFQASPTSTAVPGTPQVSVHVSGMQVQEADGDGAAGINNDGTFVGVNKSSLVPIGAQRTYRLFAQKEGSYLLYSMGDADTNGQQIELGLFGAVNVQPATAEWYRSQVTAADLNFATKKDSGGNSVKTPAGQPVLNFDAVYPAGHPRAGQPVLKMLDAQNNILYSDLTAVITGPGAGRFAGVNGVGTPDPPCSLLDDPNNTTKVDPLFCVNPSTPDRKQPYREVTVIYHEVMNAAQAFPVFNDPAIAATVDPGQDLFAINYGTGGIGAEIYANRVGVGPMGSCVDCKYEEFFLSSWTVGDPAMMVDVPANTKAPGQPCTTTTGFELGVPPCAGTRNPPPPAFPYTVTPTPKATKVLYPEDPSNVYHSYLNDHVKFRILHGGVGVNHVHHQHAGQWLQSPNSDTSQYLDSQMINPGSTYTLEMLGGGAGNQNKTPGDWLFHCHFYPHFAAGMWAVWRVHDVFEAGTALDAQGRPAQGSRALPDGETTLSTGTPIPALVPMPTIAMAPMPSPVYVAGAQKICFGAFSSGGTCDTAGAAVASNPGFPFFIPGQGGLRVPHPPLDFAPQLNASGNPIPGQFMDGGLPRHLVTGGVIANESHSTTDWSKDFYVDCHEPENQNKPVCQTNPNQEVGRLDAVQLPEGGTPVEKVAMKFHGTRNHPSFTPDGAPATFTANGLPRKPSDGFTAQNEFGSQLGAPFADPGVNADGSVAGGKTPRRYQGAVFEVDVVFNRSNWHFPQQRILALWKDVKPTLDGERETEPLFFRLNSGTLAEFWHTNLVPNYYRLDKFQVRTPTDIIGQHIHLVKFDVLSSDGAANGWNYEDGTFSPGEVQELVHAINKGSWKPLPGGPATLTLKPPPADIIPCPSNFSAATGKCKEWFGAQTTVQRWYAPPVLNNAGTDRTVGTVFTHDHYGPSTHQQAGLYAGVLVEPAGSKWFTMDEDNAEMGKRSDGGPTSWKANIITGPGGANSFREFALEFQDFQLAYDGTGNPVNPPGTPGLISSALTSNGTGPGTMSLNYRNAPVPLRVNRFGDLSRAFDSTYNPAKEINSLTPMPDNGDPETPLMMAYEGDPVQVRLLVGAHQFGHFFTINGLRWLYEPSWKNSGYKSTQPMGLSEHFELVFKAPPSSAFSIENPNNRGHFRPFTDYLYSASSDDLGMNNGLWGLFRVYTPRNPRPFLQPLPNNTRIGTTVSLTYDTCPAGLPPSKVRNYDVTATTAQKALPDPNSPTGGALVYNNRGLGRGSGSPATVPPGLLSNPWAIMYVRTEDLDNAGRLKPGVPVEPLILRANAGDCINVTLRNQLVYNTGAPQSTSKVLNRQYILQAPFDQPVFPGCTPANSAQCNQVLSPSWRVGLRPQLLSFDAASGYGIDVGYNSFGNPSVQLAAPNNGVARYRWYAGITERDAAGNMKYTPVEFGSLNLLPADPLLHHINGLYGALVVEPENSTWTCDGKGSDGTAKQVNCWAPSSASDSITTRAAATVTPAGGAPQSTFREFVLLVNEDLKMLTNPNNEETRSAVNYKAEPTFYRFGNASADRFPADRRCVLSNQLVQNPAPPPVANPLTKADPLTPVFTATAGTPARFRLLHPPAAGIVQTFALHGHVWQRNPYVNGSSALGDNQLSQWVGSIDNIGSTTHNDLLIAKSGGESLVPGDYLYTTFVPAKAQFGLWGIFRVLNPDGSVAVGGTTPDCVPAPGAQQAPDDASELLERFRKVPATKDGKPQSKN